MLSVTPGREEEFRRFSQWLATSAAIDSVIEATEREAVEASFRPLPPLIVAAYCDRLPGRVPVFHAFHLHNA